MGNRNAGMPSRAEGLGRAHARQTGNEPRRQRATRLEQGLKLPILAKSPVDGGEYNVGSAAQPAQEGGVVREALSGRRKLEIEIAGSVAVELR